MVTRHVKLVIATIPFRGGFFVGKKSPPETDILLNQMETAIQLEDSKVVHFLLSEDTYLMMVVVLTINIYISLLLWRPQVVTRIL